MRFLPIVLLLFAMLCMVHLNRPDEGELLFRQLKDESGDRWPPRAGCQLWLLYIRQKNHEKADDLLDSLKSRFSFERLASLVPSSTRNEIRSAYLRELDTVGKLLRYNPNRIQNLERAVAIDKFLSPDNRGTRQSQWQLIRGYRYFGDLKKALQLTYRLRPLFADPTIALQLSRLLRMTENPGEALLEINKLTFDESGTKYRRNILLKTPFRVHRQSYERKCFGKLLTTCMVQSLRMEY